MPIPYQNRRNNRMRSNMTPPPVRSPYLSYQQLQQYATKYPVEPEQPREDNEITTLQVTPAKNATETKPVTQTQIPQDQPQTEQVQDIPSKTAAQSETLPRDMDQTAKDFAYFIGLYPEAARTILTEIQKEVDKVDYEGSFIYDEYPDKTTLYRLALTIYNRVSPLTQISSVYPQEKALERLQFELEGDPDYSRLPAIDSPFWLFNLITLLVYHDLILRRRKKRPQ